MYIYSNDIGQIIESIEDAINGLLWYQDMHPEHYSAADEDMIANLRKSLEILKGENNG